MVQQEAAWEVVTTEEFDHVNKTLDPTSPDFKYTDPILVAQSDGVEDNDAIDRDCCSIQTPADYGALTVPILDLSD